MKKLRKRTLSLLPAALTAILPIYAAETLPRSTNRPPDGLRSVSHRQYAALHAARCAQLPGAGLPSLFGRQTFRLYL